MLKLNESTREAMRAKHPDAAPLYADALLSGAIPPDVHPSIFAAINGDVVKKCCLRTKGGAGVSQQEDTLWHKMTTGFKDVSSGLCNAVAAIARP